VVEQEASERESHADLEHSTVLASACADAEGLARRIALLEGELAEECRAQEMCEREHRECFEELTLLQTRAPCCIMLLSVLLRNDICLRGFDMQHSNILRSPRSLPHFGLRCPLPRSQCLGARPAIPPTRRW
jgi:hypothetical protein